MKLYASHNSGNSWKIRILLSLLDVPCERMDLDFFGQREHKAPWFMKINPRGQVPAMEIEGQHFWDSTAHLVYIRCIDWMNASPHQLNYRITWAF